MYQPIVEIKKPCHEILENRKPGEQGNYCKTCRITVVDFTTKTPDEISQYLKNEQVHCGTFNRKDVSTGSRTDKFISYLQARNLKFAAVLLLSFVLLISCRVRRGKTIQGNMRLYDKNNPSIENLK